MLFHVKPRPNLKY